MKRITFLIVLAIFGLSFHTMSQVAPSDLVGAVYAMSNGEGQIDGNVQGPNSVIAYAQAEDGTLSPIGSFPTGGNGGDYDGGEGIDPLISAYALTKTNDNRFVLAVNAGSSSITSMKVNEDFSLTAVDTESTEDIGPNSIAYVPSRTVGVNGLVYVSNITRTEFLELGEPGQQGSVIGYRLLDDGSLEPIAGSIRDLANRPSAVQFSPDGDFLVVASINAGASALASDSQDEIVVYGVNADGTLSDAQLSAATSTLRGNTEGRNLPSAIGFQIVQDNYVVVTEAREFQPDGAPPAFPALQDGSVSTWQIETDGSLTAIDLDVASGENNTGRTACWLDFSDDNTFFVSNALEAGLASYSFNDGDIELLDQTAAQGIGATGNTTDPGLAFSTTEAWIDMWISDDGNYLYQMYGLTGKIGVFGIDGAELTLLQEIGGLPQSNVQGIVSVGRQAPADEVTACYRVTFDALWSETTHPEDFPGDESNIARWSPIAGLTHNSSVSLFETGDIASQGLVNISQSGSRDPLDSELAGVILSGAGEFYIESDTRVRPSPDTISTTFCISASHPLVSLTSMIAPSPDWIVALRDFNLLEGGDFVESTVVQFVPYDTGSDSGTSFTSENEDTQPREGISLITDGPASADGSSFGIWRFERIDAGSNCDVEGGSLTGGPFTFCVDGVVDNIPEDDLTVSNNSGSNNQWVITDERGFILGLPPSISGPNFDGAGVGVCYIYNMAYEGTITGLEMGNNIEDLAGCFDLSNSVYVDRVDCGPPTFDCADNPIVITHNVDCGQGNGIYNVQFSINGGGAGSQGGVYNVTGDFTGTVVAGQVRNITGLAEGTIYNITVIDDGFGCSASITNGPNNCSKLPIELLDFNGEVITEGNLLKWVTASEIENDYFGLYRSNDGKDYELIHQQEGEGTTSTTQQYQFLDRNGSSGITYYQLQQTDFDGTTHTVGNVALLRGETDLSIVNIIPMPIEDQFELLLTHNQNEPIQIEIHNHIGQSVYEQTSIIHPQLNFLQFNVTDLSSGVYLLSVRTTDKIVSEKLIKY